MCMYVYIYISDGSDGTLPKGVYVYIYISNIHINFTREGIRIYEWYLS